MGIRILFKKYPTLEDYVKAERREFENDIKSTGFYRNKASNILASARIVRDRHNGQVPNRMEDLIALPGVARKTANIVRGEALGVASGIAVDTHVKRLSRLLGLTDEENPDKIERDLMRIIPRTEWNGFSLRLIEYGRRFCPAKRHDHTNCLLTKLLEP